MTRNIIDWKQFKYISGVTYIYVLRHPASGAICYVGQASYPARRYNGHIAASKYGRTKSQLWVKGLRAEGYRPIMEIIMIIKDRFQLANTMEVFFIRYFQETLDTLQNGNSYNYPKYNFFDGMNFGTDLPDLIESVVDRFASRDAMDSFDFEFLGIRENEAVRTP